MNKNNSKNKINLAIVPKVHWFHEYSRAYGSQHDFNHIKKCLNSYHLINNYFNYKIIYINKFVKNFDQFDAVLFLGSNAIVDNFLKSNKKIKKYLWAFNQFAWVNNPKIYDSTNIVFEQSNENIDNYKNKNNVIKLPLGFQNTVSYLDNNKTVFDLVFNGTLDRELRLNQKFLRRDLLIELLKLDLKILNYNGRANKFIEKKLLSPLNKFKNFSIINRFGDGIEYNHAKYSLDIPFLNLGAKKNENWGMSEERIDNGIWLNHWDTFRAIGAKTNIITFDAPEIRKLGLSEDNVNFYKSDPLNIKKMAEEISNIVKNGAYKKIDHSTWKKNTYFNRWINILNNIYNDINKENSIKLINKKNIRNKLQIGISCGLNSEHYTNYLISSIEKTKSNETDIEIIISINHRNVDINFLNNIKTSIPIKIFTNYSFFGNKDSFQHGKNIDYLISKFDSKFGAIMDSDVVLLKNNWDKILLDKLNKDVVIIGTPYKQFHYLKFPNAIFCIFKTDIIKNLKIKFKPTKRHLYNFIPFIPSKVSIRKVSLKNKKFFSNKVNEKILFDVGYQLPLKIKKNNLDGISFDFIDSTSNKAKLKTLKGEEYHFEDEIILSHLGRSTKRDFLTDKYCINWKELTSNWLKKNEK